MSVSDVFPGGLLDFLTLSSLKTGTNTFADSVDPDETANNEPSQ